MIRSGKICLSLIYNYLLAPKDSDKDSTTEFNNRNNKLKSVTKVFENYGGVLAKISQILSIDDANSTTFSECKPFSREKTIDYLKTIYKENKDGFFSNVKYIDFDVLNSGSIGQVHKGIIDDSTPVIFKVQYIGLQEQIKNDVHMLDLIVNFLYNFDLTDTLTNIKQKLNEELDYSRECDNQEIIRTEWLFNKNIIVPKLYRNLCNDKIICMEYVNGISFIEFANTASFEHKNYIAKLLVEFTYTNIHKKDLFYSDIHYGNFLIVPGDDDNFMPKLCILDFGCLHSLEDGLSQKIKNLHKNIFKTIQRITPTIEDQIDFLNCVKDLGIVSEDNTTVAIGSDEFNYMYEYFKQQYEPWVNKDFEFTEEKLELISKKDIEMMKSWNVPTNMVYFNKIPFGLFHLLTKMKVKHDFTGYFNEMLNIND